MTDLPKRLGHCLQILVLFILGVQSQLTQSHYANSTINGSFYDAFYSIKTIINKLSLSSPLGNAHGPFVYFDFVNKRKIVVLNDYIEDSNLNNFKSTLNKNYLYTKIHVNISKQCSASSCPNPARFKDIGNSPLVLCTYL